MKSFLKHLLLLVVFLTGASVLIVEVVATRILSPYFGNTIFTYSSVIGIVLAALSLGYYFGGRIADRKPFLHWFFFIIFLGGLSVFILEFFMLSFLPLVAYRFSLISGPVVSSLFLFFLPSVLLGTLSPYTIKLVDKYSTKQGVGTISGLVFFWSTLGSIFGSFFAGFFLIPKFGIHQIIFSIACLLTLMGLVGLYFSGVKKNLLLKLLVVSLVVSAFLFISAFFNDAQGVVFQTDGMYEKISIVDQESGGRTIRYLIQDRSSSGAMYLDSDELVIDYTKYYSIYKVFNRDIKNVLAIGGGAYSIPKAYLSQSPDIQVDVVEIEPGLFDLAKEYFAVPDDSRLKNYIKDGRRFLYDSDKKYDVIFSDVYYSLYSIPSHFTTLEFFKLVKDRLNDEGIFIANIIGSLSRQKPSLLFSEVNTLKKVFPNFYLFATESSKTHYSQNMILVGFNSEKIIDFNDKQVLNNPDPIISSLAGKYVDLKRFPISDNSVFVDNYAPIEYFTAALLKSQLNEYSRSFDSLEAYSLIKQQLSFGPRFISSEGHEKTKDLLISELNAFSKEVVVQEWLHTMSDKSQVGLTNVISRFFPEKERRILIGTHYDSKRYSDQDKSSPDLPVPGANDSASGTAILLELAHVLANSDIYSSFGIDLVFFDGEEGEENLPPATWSPLGSSYFAENIKDIYEENPESVIIIDMVCDEDLEIFQEQSSLVGASELVSDFWKKARIKYPSVFIDKVKHQIEDDHSPFLQLGIPSILIIDYDYPYFHTSKDTLDKCSRDSLQVVGDSLLNYIYSL